MLLSLITTWLVDSWDDVVALGHVTLPAMISLCNNERMKFDEDSC